MIATRFSEEGSNSKEVSLLAGAIPNNTKASTAWGIWIWNEWAIGRATTPVAADGIAALITTLLEMSRVDHVEFKKCAIIGYCTLKSTISGLLHTF